MRPFSPDDWPDARREASAALWAFYDALDAPRSITDAHDEAARCRDQKDLAIMPAHIAQRAYAACQRHELDGTLLAAQVRAAASMVSPVRFEKAGPLLAYVQARCGAHALLLMQLTGKREQFWVERTQEFAKAVFLTNRLCSLVADVAKDRLFLPQSEMAQFGIAEAQLKAGQQSESLRRLLWKQAVRVRDAYSACQRLGLDLTGWPRRTFKRYWMEGLYLLSVLEKRQFDVWTQPVALSPAMRLQLRWQLLVGKTSFR